MGIFKYTVFSFSVTHGILYFFYDLVLRNAAALPTMARYRQLCVKILTRLYSTRYPWIPVARNYVSAHTLTDEKVLIPSPDSRRHTIYFHENLLSSRETQAFCGTRVAWCIPPARKLICPGDYAPYFIMRRYVYIFPPGREPSPCYQNKDDRTTPPPSFSLFLSFLFPPFSFMRRFHRFDSSIESLRVCKSARSSIVTSLPFFFSYPPPNLFILEKDKRYDFLWENF